MSSQTAEELRAFHGFLSEMLNGDANGLSPEEALDEWRQLHPSSDAADEDIAAVREALDDMAKGGRGIPFDKFDSDFRRRHNLPT